MSSPFARVLELADLPPAFHEQLVAANVVLAGEMDVVWHRPRWIRPLLSLLARWDVLFPDVGEHVPAELRIDALDGGHAWSRRFEFPRERRFDAVLLVDERGRLVERIGRLDVGWDVRFCPPDRIEIRTTGTAVRLARFRVLLPRLLRADATAVELARGPDRIEMTMSISHLLVGRFFGYSGTFVLSRPDDARAV